MSYAPKVPTWPNKGGQERDRRYRHCLHAWPRGVGTSDSIIFRQSLISKTERFPAFLGVPRRRNVCVVSNLAGQVRLISWKGGVSSL